MNYQGQSHTVRFQLPPGPTVENVQAAFKDVYRARYGHLNEGTGLAFVVLRVGGLVPRNDLNSMPSEPLLHQERRSRTLIARFISPELEHG